MRFGSICSGVEAVSQALPEWDPAFYAEIEPAACAILAARHGATRPRNMPDPGEAGIDRKEARLRAAVIRKLDSLRWGERVPNAGDFTLIEGEEYGPIDALWGGTPCQDYSQAGLRAGLDGNRGNLTLAYARLAYRSRARWLAWENVPGVFSLNDGQDFGAILATFSGRHGMVFQPPRGGWRNSGIVAPADERSFGLAWRVLDAQHFGIPQRRRRVFLVGYIGDWRPAAAVLLERHSLSGCAPPSRQKGPRTAAVAGSSTVLGGAPGEPCPILDGVAGTLCADTHPGAYTGQDAYQNRLIPQRLVYAPELADPLVVNEAGTYTHEGKNNFRMRNVVAFDTTQITHPANRSNPQPGDPCHSLAAAGHPPTIAFSAKDYGQDAGDDLAPTMRAGMHDGSHQNGGVMPAVAYRSTVDVAGAICADSFSGGMGGRPEGAAAGHLVTDEEAFVVRRLTPRECERLQGFPDDYTLVPFGGNRTTADARRYQALGNSMAVPVIRWIGKRMEAVDALLGGKHEGGRRDSVGRDAVGSGGLAAGADEAGVRRSRAGAG